MSKINIDEFGRYTRLKSYVNPVLAKAYFQRNESTPLKTRQVIMKTDALLRKFIFHGEIEYSMQDKNFKFEFDAFLRSFEQNVDQQYSFLSGAGCSISSGVPSAY